MNIKRTLRRLSVVAAPLVLAAVLIPQAATAVTNTTVVTPGNMQGWGFAPEAPLGQGQTGQLVSGPETPPLGVGGAQLTVGSTGGQVLATSGYQGLAFSDVDTLQYSTYRTSGAPALAIALQFDFDDDVTDADDAFKGRIVYEPYHTQTVTTGEWQTWNALDDTAGTGTGSWWLSNGAQAAAHGCAQATPCTLAEILAISPNAGIRNTTNPNVWLKAGSGWTGGFDGNVDALTINDDVYDFEPTVTVASKEACKNDGWKTSNTPYFKNQGECVSSFVRKNQ